MVIHPEIIVTPDLPTIKFRVPREQVDLDTELPRILHGQGWGCGTYFHVQFVSHDRTTLLSSAAFVVCEEIESLQTNEANPYQPITKTMFQRKAAQIGDWWGGGNGDEPEPLLEPDIPPEPKVVWNPGLKLHQVKIGDEVLYENQYKGKAVEQRNRIAAERR